MLSSLKPITSRRELTDHSATKDQSSYRHGGWILALLYTCWMTPGKPSNCLCDSVSPYVIWDLPLGVCVNITWSNAHENLEQYLERGKYAVNVSYHHYEFNHFLLQRIKQDSRKQRDTEGTRLPATRLFFPYFFYVLFPILFGAHQLHTRSKTLYMEKNLWGRAGPTEGKSKQGGLAEWALD